MFHVWKPRESKDVASFVVIYDLDVGDLKEYT
jgi:hypothetical protein